MDVQEGFLNKNLKTIPLFVQKTIKHKGLFVYEKTVSYGFDQIWFINSP